MDLSTITVQDFKDNFFRDFAYLITWSDAKTYYSCDEVYYAVTKRFYKCVTASTTALPTVEAAWQIYSDDIYNYVLDADIEKAFKESQIVFNQGLFSSDEQLTLGYLYLTAHYLVQDLKAAQQGVSDAGSFAVSSRSVGNVSESYAIPTALTDDPVLSYFTKTQYGQKYLSMVLPLLVGNMAIAQGATTP